MSEADADQQINRPLTEYQVVVEGRDMTLFYKNEEKFFQTNSFLMMKETKQRISPNLVAYERGKGRKIIHAAISFFLKKAASEQDSIPSGETSIEFHCKLGNSTLQTSFDSRKMVDQNGPDF
ncbi:MAG: hypothetical protein ACYDD2_09040 [Candidatus Acidiferrales bacterium]